MFVLFGFSYISKMSQQIDKSASRLRFLVMVACIISGFLAGENLNRYAIEVPAWLHVNMISWAQYSRYADLGTGLFIYPIEAIGSAILLIAASVTVVSNAAFKHVALPLYASTLFALAGLFFTLFAAPYVLSVRTTPDDPELLQQAFNKFHFWGFLRALMQVASFCTCVWAMGRVFRLKE
jgi:hypothetical protein